MVLALSNLFLSRTLTRNVRWVDLEQKDKTVDADENNATNVNSGVTMLSRLSILQASKEKNSNQHDPLPKPYLQPPDLCDRQRQN